MPSERLFSQADFDKGVEERLARERAKYADYDDLKKLKESRESDIEAAKGEVRAQYQAEIVTTTATSVARSLGFHDPADALTLPNAEGKLAIDKDALPLDKDGKPDTDKIKASLEKLAKDRPYLVASEKPAVRRPSSRPKLGSGNTDPEGQPKMNAVEALQRFAVIRKHS
jgi:hypothetical protein